MQPEKKAGGNSARFYHRVVDMACSVLCSCCADDVSIKSPDPSTPTDRVPSPPTSGGSRPPNTPFRPFKRSSSGLEGYKKDVAILSTVYLFQDHVTLKRLAVLLASNARHEDEGDSELANILLKCAQFTARLAVYAEEDPGQSKSAIEEFSSVVSTLSNVDREDSNSLKQFEERVDQVTEKLTASHSSLAREVQVRKDSGLATLLLDWGTTIFDILKDASEVLPVPVLKPVFASLAGLFRATRQTQINFGQMEVLCFMAGDLAIRLAEKCSRLEGLPRETMESIERFEKDLLHIAEQCRELSKKTWFECFFQNAHYKDKLDDLGKLLTNAAAAFQNDQLLQLEANYQYLKDATAQSRLDHLPHHPDDSGQRNEFLENSRPRATEDVFKWMSTSRDLIIWIHGQAGVGKSTFSRHVTERLRQTDRLAASVRLNTIRKDWGPETVIKLLAAELGRNHPRAVDGILSAVGECNERSFKDHVEKCIRDPVSALGYPHPLIIVMDAVDEWPFYEALIKELVHLRSSSHPLMKFILTSRSDPQRSHFPNISIHLYHLPIVPDDVVKRYLESRFLALGWEDNRQPSSKQIHQLAKLCGGLLICAATIYGLVKQSLDENDQASRVVNEILTSEMKLGSSETLKKLYRDVINYAFPSLDKRRLFRDYLGLTMVLQEPLDIYDFSTLAEIKVNDIKQLHTRIAAFCQLPLATTAKSVSKIYPASTTFHLSFLQFVQDQEAVTEVPFITISPSVFHARLGQACLKVVFISAPPPSPGPRIPDQHTNAYRYAAKFWTLHVSNGTDRATWRTTRHHDQLQAVTIEGMQRWARVFADCSQPKITINFDSLLDNHPAAVLYELADGLAAIDSIKSAVDCLEVAARLRPTSIPIWHRLGGGYRRLSADVWDADRAILDKAATALQNALTIWEAYCTASPSNLPSIARAAPKQNPFPHDIPDLEELVSMRGEELGLTSEVYELYQPLVCALGSVLQARFEQEVTNEECDVNGDGKEAIRLYTHALQVPLGDQAESRCALLYNIASVHYTFYARTGSPDHLNSAILFGKKALDDCPLDDAESDAARSLILRALGKFYRVAGSVNDAIETLQNALKYCHNPEDKTIVLNEYSDALRTQFENSPPGPLGPSVPSQSLTSLDHAISLRKEALKLCPESHPSRSEMLYRLGNDLHRRYQCNISQSDQDSSLRESIRSYEEALELRRACDDHRFLTLTQLSVALLDHFKKQGGQVDEIISLLSDALSFEEETTIAGSERATCYGTMAEALYFRWKNKATPLLSDEEDIHRAIALQRQILNMQSLEPVIYTNSLFALAEMHEALPDQQVQSLFHRAHALSSRFEQTQSTSDLDEVMQICAQLLQIIPPGDVLVDRCEELSGSAAQRKGSFEADGPNEPQIQTLGTILE